MGGKERAPRSPAEGLEEHLTNSPDSIPPGGDRNKVLRRYPHNGLQPQHEALLAASAISAETAKARGYRTVEEKTRLKGIGITTKGRNTPGLEIPLLRKDGSRWGYQYRPDHPRERSGKIVKYETPLNQRNRLDVPPGVGDQLGDPSVPLFITEGTRKADAAASAGLACVSLIGVWNWRGTNAQGGKTAIPDWEDVALEGRRVVLAFDSDVVIKPEVRGALVRLAEYLGSKGSSVEYLHLPPNGDKCGLDDYLADHSVEDLWALVRPELPESSPDDPEPLAHLTPQGERAIVPSVAPEPPKIASDQRILDRFKADVRRCGVVGEEDTAAIVYLEMITRFLDKPGAAVMKGASSSGKSYTVEQTLRFFPTTAYVLMTAMSERALVYNTEDYRHRMLVIYEAVALREGIEGSLTAYFVRSLLSEGKIRYPVTIKNKEGRFVTETIEKDGPTGLILTTTATHLHPENETRMLSLATDDSRDQTERVLLELANEEVAAVDFREWHSLQEWLSHAEHRVTIPFGEALAKAVPKPAMAVRLRRDFGAVLSLIRAHAILHQLNRERDHEGQIVATLEDYEVVRRLVADLVSQGVGATVSDATRDTVAAVDKLTASSSEGVTAKQVAIALDLDPSAARRRLMVASRDSYVRNLEERRGQPGRWVVGDPMPDEVEVLPPSHHLVPRETAGHKGDGTVARKPEGDKSPQEEGGAIDKPPAHEEAEATILAAFENTAPEDDPVAYAAARRADGATDWQIAQECDRAGFSPAVANRTTWTSVTVRRLLAHPEKEEAGE